MSKTLCLFSYQTSSWISCQKIVANLWKNYKSSTLQVSSLHFGPEQNGQDLLSLAQTILELKPDRISFIDHRPHPIDLLKFLLPLWMKKHSTFPELVFHLYGDFTLNYPLWSALGTLAKGVKIKFCVASSAQKRLMEKLIPGEIFILPFAVDEKDFYYEKNLRTKIRQDLKLRDDQKLFIFTGRLSYQKNIHILTAAFLQYLQNSNSDSKLLIFGHFDDLQDTFAHHKSSIGQYFHQVNAKIKNHPRAKQIQFMGMVNSTKLNEYYNGSDYFINLSTHNDEDFGMSIAEASLCGLASIMTAWGGLNDFNFQENHYLPVSIRGEKKIDLSSFDSYLNSPNNYDRKSLSLRARQRFAVTSTTLKLEEILQLPAEEFQEFKELFHRVKRSTLFSDKTYIDVDNKLNSLYQELYESYLG